MNLDSIGRAKAESTLEILHPATGNVVENDDGTTMTITLFGEYSDEWRTAFYERTKARIERARETGETSMSYKDMEAENFEITCRCTKEWNLTDKDGPVEFSLEKVREIYTAYPWVYQQARSHMENASNFFGPIRKDLIAYAQKVFALDARDDKGVSMREYLQQRARSSGKVAPELKLPPFPDAGQHLWNAFMDLHRGRGYGMNGPEPFTWVDIQAWCNLRDKMLSPEELDVVLDLDREWINAR